MGRYDYQMCYYGQFKISEQTCFLRSYETSEVLAKLKTDSKTYHYQVQKRYSPSQNTLELFNLLFQFPFTSSKTELDHYHYKLNVRVTSRVVKRLKNEVKSRNRVRTQSSAQSPLLGLNTYLKTHEIDVNVTNNVIIKSLL